MSYYDEVDIFHVNINRTPRTYYKAQASNGRVGLRGSSSDVYSYAVIQLTNPTYENELVSWVTYHSSEQLAKRQLTYLTNHYSNKYGSETYSFELVKLEKITAKEFRQYKALQKKGYTKYNERLRQQIIQHAGITISAESEGN